MFKCLKAYRNCGYNFWIPSEKRKKLNLTSCCNGCFWGNGGKLYLGPKIDSFVFGTFQARRTQDKLEPFIQSSFAKTTTIAGNPSFRRRTGQRKSVFTVLNKIRNLWLC